MCGIVGIYSHEKVAAELYDSLVNLQHRGQDAAGILTCQQRFDVRQGLGLVREVFNEASIGALNGNMGIGHTRYPTAGGYALSDVQPLWVGTPRGVALAHNGNLTNYRELLAEITAKHRHMHSGTDSEVILHLLADGLHGETSGEEDETAFFEGLCDAVRHVFRKARGSFSVVSLVIGKGLVAFRDPHGIRPLVLGERVREDGRKDYILASETTMFYALGFESLGDVAPGEVIYINQEGTLFRKVLASAEFRPCVFEYVYFARPDSTLDGISVYRARLRMGQNLARQWKARFGDLLPDIVIPAPFTSNTAALSFAHELGVRYSEGLYKNPFVGRTFIMPDAKSRKRQVRYKLTPQRTEISNKRVLILDDSLVRGTTSREIVRMVREYGAKAVYFALACPPIRHPCYYGIDMPSEDELLAASLNEEQIRAWLDADILLYQTEEALLEAVTRRGAPEGLKPCKACMDGDYVTGDLNVARRRALACERITERGDEFHLSG